MKTGTLALLLSCCVALGNLPTSLSLSFFIYTVELRVIANIK